MPVYTLAAVENTPQHPFQGTALGSVRKTGPLILQLKDSSESSENICFGRCVTAGPDVPSREECGMLLTNIPALHPSRASSAYGRGCLRLITWTAVWQTLAKVVYNIWITASRCGLPLKYLIKSFTLSIWK